MNTVGTIIIAVISALGTSGALGYLFKSWSERPAHKQHQLKAWEEFKDNTLKDAKATAKENEEHITLCEYKIELLAELNEQLINNQADMGLDPAIVAENRAKNRRIKFLREVPPDA